MIKVLQTIYIKSKNERYSIYEEENGELSIVPEKEIPSLEKWAKKYLSESSSKEIIYLFCKRTVYAFFVTKRHSDFAGESLFGKAVCHKDDIYNKEIGMAIALARLYKEEGEIFF